MDPSVEVLLTENIRHFIRTVLLTSNLPNDMRDELRKYSGGTRRSTASTNNSDDGRRPRTIPFQLLHSVHDMQLVKGDLPCDLPCAASLAGIQPVRPRAQRTSP